MGVSLCISRHPGTIMGTIIIIVIVTVTAPYVVCALTMRACSDSTHGHVRRYGFTPADVTEFKASMFVDSIAEAV